MPRFLGVVVLYRPDAGVSARIKSYLGELSQLLVVDNSEEPSGEIAAIQRLGESIHVLNNDGNLGIARALNQAVEHGLQHGFDWLLTMDQDSEFTTGSLARMKAYLSSVEDAPGILSPFHHTPGGPLPAANMQTKSVRITMTSGNLLSLAAAAQCGPFEEKLFIDSVDHEYCLRLRKQGYRITRLNAAILEHKLGEISYHRFAFMKLKTTNHSPLRKYYITRNRLFVICRYIGFDPRFAWRESVEMVKAFWAVLLFEEAKGRKLSAMLTGAWHFLKGRYGKF